MTYQQPRGFVDPLAIRTAFLSREMQRSFSHAFLTGPWWQYAPDPMIHSLRFIQLSRRKYTLAWPRPVYPTVPVSVTELPVFVQNRISLDRYLDLIVDEINAVTGLRWPLIGG